MAKKNSSSKASEPGIVPSPQTYDEFVESGWDHYSKKEFYRAEADFQKAQEISPDNPDTLYAMGMAQQASGRVQDSIHTFEKTIQILQNSDSPDNVRAHMLIKLARGHISRMKTGDWNLDK